MKCPHCLNYINPSFEYNYYGKDNEGLWFTSKMACPNPSCKKLIITLINSDELTSNQYGHISRPKNPKVSINIRPLTSSRPPVAAEVDGKFASDYNEACLILSFSPKASAALSRRCLQNVLREKANVKKSDLSKEIQEVISNSSLPSHLSKSIDAIRNIGNFAAHPVKSTSTGEIVDVEIGEAEWLLDVLESLFDFYFVQPAILRAKKDALNSKLKEIGKPPMK